MYIFRPMEVMYQETSNAVMAALMIHDIVDTSSVAYPEYKLANPFELFSIGGFHGGNWRTAYTINSLGGPSYLWGLLVDDKRKFKSFVLPSAAALTAAAAGFIGVLVKIGAPHKWGFF